MCGYRIMVISKDLQSTTYTDKLYSRMSTAVRIKNRLTKVNRKKNYYHVVSNEPHIPTARFIVTQ